MLDVSNAEFIDSLCRRILLEGFSRGLSGDPHGRLRSGPERDPAAIGSRNFYLGNEDRSASSLLPMETHGRMGIRKAERARRPRTRLWTSTVCINLERFSML